MLRPADIKQSIDLVSIISESVQLKRSGRRLMGLCPFHSEKHPSFCVDPEKQLFYCHGCGAGGDVFNFVMKLHNYSFHEALTFLAEKAGIREIEDERLKFLKQLQTLFRKTLLLSQKAKIYLTKRKITPEKAEHFGMGLAPKNLLQILKEKNQLLQAQMSGFKNENFIRLLQGRLTLPFYDRCGNLVGFAARTLNNQAPKYINTEETEFFKKKNLLFGLNFLKQREKVYIVEGYFDCISCLINGIPSVAAGSTSLTTHQAKLLKGFDRVVVAFDGDHAGKKATMRAFKILVAADIYPHAIFLPEGEDPDSLLRKGKKEQFLRLHEKDLFKLIINTIEKLPPQKAITKLNNLAGFLANIHSPLSKLLLQQIRKTFSIKIEKQTRKHLETEEQILQILLSSPELVENLEKRQLFEAMENSEIRKTLKYFAKHKTLPEGHTHMNLLARASIYPAQKNLIERAIRYLERKKVCREIVCPSEKS